MNNSRRGRSAQPKITQDNQDHDNDADDGEKIHLAAPTDSNLTLTGVFYLEAKHMQEVRKLLSARR